MRSGEFTAKRAIRRQYAGDFAYSEKLLRAAHRIHRLLCEKDVPPRQNHLKFVAVGLWMKICKQLRSILVLCELGLVEDAEIIARSLFESTVQTAFVLKRNIRLSRGWRTAPKPPRGGYSAQFRAKLYLAHGVLSDEKLTRIWREDKDARLRSAAHIMAPTVAEQIKDVQTWLGSAWMAWLRDRSSAAFKVETMARNVGLEGWYHGVYRPQSSPAHAIDALSHLRATDHPATIDAELGADVERVPGALHLANALCGAAGQFVNSRFRLGFDKTLKDLAAQARALLDGT